MRAVDLITKTQHKEPLSKEEIQYLISSYVKGDVPDYQVAAWLMAVYFNGLTKEETFFLTDAMLNSGDTIDLSMIDGIKVDKHSTGGVGDKTSLVLGPLAAACGCKVAKLSGRGLGHTGGTLDKLESIPGVTISLTLDRFIKQVKDIGVAIAGQTANLVPADKLLYALRDVTSTVESLPLIASSIMSKKLASGTDVICIDVKYGSGAFMKTIKDAENLSHAMISLAKLANKKVVCFISEMNNPLGKTIGNRLEVKEAVDCLKGKGPKDLEELCLRVCGYMCYFSGITKTQEEGYSFAKEKLYDGSAYKKFLELIKAQGALDVDFDNFIEVDEVLSIKSKEEEYIEHIDALTLGLVSMRLGAGRERKEDPVDFNVGIELTHIPGDKVKVGDELLKIYRNKKWDDRIIDDIYSAYSFSKEKIEPIPVISEIIE